MITLNGDEGVGSEPPFRQQLPLALRAICSDSGERDDHDYRDQVQSLLRSARFERAIRPANLVVEIAGEDSGQRFLGRGPVLVQGLPLTHGYGAYSSGVFGVSCWRRFAK